MGRLPTEADFPEKIKLSITPPPKNAPPTNILLLLHGLGDTHTPFTTLATQLSLPETACISLRAPQPLLDLGGFHWGDDIIFDSSSGGLDADSGFDSAGKMLREVIVDVLGGKCGFKLREVVLFGFGQGGMAALDAGVKVHEAAGATADAGESELGGIVSVGGALPGAAPGVLEPKCKTPVLVCAGSDGSAVTAGAEEKLARVFGSVEVKRYRRPGDGMPSNRDEMMPIMQFFARRLRSTAGVPGGSVEVA